ERPRHAEALLLTTGERECAVPQPILHFVPQGRSAQRTLDRGIELALGATAVHLQPGGHIVVNLHRRERSGPLEHHADAAPQLDRIDTGIVDVLTVEQHFARDPAPLRQLVHAVQTAQEGRLAAPGRADQRGDRVLWEEDRYVLDHG